MILHKKTKDFKLQFEACWCFVDYDWKMLLLLRKECKPEWCTWGSPWWKIWNNENKISCILREIREETNINILENDLIFLKSYFIRFPKYDFIYHQYYSKLKYQPNVIINPEEHQKYKWLTPEEALKFPLIEDEDYCIKDFYKI